MAVDTPKKAPTRPDPELVVMRRLMQALNGLEGQARVRTLEYVKNRIEAELAAEAKRTAP